MFISLRARLILLMATASVITAGLLTWDFVVDRENGIASAKESLLNRTELIAARQQSIVNRAGAILNGLMLSANVAPGSSNAACASELAAWQRSEPQFHNVVKALPNGDLVCASSGLGEPVNLADRAYFRAALKRPEMVVSNVFVGRVISKPSIAFSKAMRDDSGSVTGVLILILDLDWLGRELAGSNPRDGTQLAVVDANGDVAVTLPADEKSIGTNIRRSEVFQKTRDAQAYGTFESINPRGEARLFAHVTLLKTVSGPMHLLQSVPIDSVLADVKQDSVIKFAAAIGMLLAVMGVVIGGVNRLAVHPMEKLAEAAKRFSEGDLNARSGLKHTGDEIGQLALTLDGAAVAIAEREKQLAASEQRFRRLNELSSDWIWERDEDLRLTYVSPSYVALSGEPNESIVGLPLAEYLKSEDGVLSAQLLAHRPFRDLESARRRPDGAIFWRGLSGEPIFDASGNFKGFRGTGRDITERKRLEKELQRQATTDALTGLPNRAVLGDRIEHAIERASRGQHVIAVVMLDLDDFKQINDAVGHEWGDAMLRLVAERIKACVRPEDTVARLGGDEFIVVLEDLPDGASVQEVVDRLQEAIAEPAEIQGHVLHTSGSIGIAVYPRDGVDAAELLRNCDAAMYHAKSLGGGASHFFTQSLNDRAARHVTLREELEVALERAEFELYYQPIVDCSDGRIIGAEALLRWHRGGTIVAPGEFLDVAEATGLIVQIGAWVLRQACVQAQAWQALGAASPYVSVNVSAHQFRDGRLFGQVVSALEASQLPADRLVLELTESTMMLDQEAGAKTLEEIAALGVQLAIDDFGTGYSSLSYLKRFPVRKLKIDQSFVRDAPTDSDDAGIVRAVIELGHALDLLVVAEGVETYEQAELLRRLGCDQMQGYRFARPMPVRDLEALLRLNHVRPKTPQRQSIPAVEP